MSEQPTKYVSTRGGIAPVEFQDAVLMGLADDGGLLIPQAIPDVRDRLARWTDLPYDRLALEVLALFVGDIPRRELDELVHRTYTGGAFSPSPAPTVAVGPIHVLELWHGPTLAFKDIALQLLGNLFEHILRRRPSVSDGRLNVLGATSGDTGSAAIFGLRGRRGIHIFMMHPHGRISPIQARQMTTVLDGNVHNIAVEGSFDDCQRIMKTLASDLPFKRRMALGAVNSVNWARVLAQIVYYFRSSLDVQKATGAANVHFAVPTGNFGDILAGWYAMQMGAPISRLILATNANDILARFFNTGVYSQGSLHQTLSPAMDIQAASNFERYLFYRLGQDSARLREAMASLERTGAITVPVTSAASGSSVASGCAVDESFQAGAATRDEVLATIRRFHEQYDYLLDPHTAVGVAVATRLVCVEGVSPSCIAGVPPASERGMGVSPVSSQFPAVSSVPSSEQQQSDRAGTALERTGGTPVPHVADPLVCISTAHPAKFPAAIRLATGKNIARHSAIDALTDLPTRCATLPNDAQAVREFIEKTVTQNSESWNGKIK